MVFFMITCKKKFNGFHLPIPSVVLDTDKTNDKHVIQTGPIEPAADKDCVLQLVLADIKNLPSQLTYVDNNQF